MGMPMYLVKPPMPPRAVLPTPTVVELQLLPPIPPGIPQSPTFRPTLQRLPGSLHTAFVLLHSHPGLQLLSLDRQATPQYHAGALSLCRDRRSSSPVYVP